MTAHRRNLNLTLPATVIWRVTDPRSWLRVGLPTVFAVMILWLLAGQGGAV